ncbi:MAG: alpha-mannosidase [Opitutae bacterium]|nr:alpha-mannosidase [Opitutae bacterium]
MLPANPFLQLVPARAQVALDRLRKQIWREVVALEIEATAASPRQLNWAEACRQPLQPVQTPTHWGKLWDQRWFRLRVPEKFARRDDLYLEWQDQAEATLYHEGMPYYGFDVAHRQAPVPRGGQLWIESIVCQTGIWHPAATGLDTAGSKLTGARLVSRDELAWSVYHDLLVLNDLMREELVAQFGAAEVNKFYGFGSRPVITDASPLLRQLLRHLDHIVDALDRDDLKGARRRLATAYRDLPAAPNAMRAVATGHAHIDLVWLWPERVGEFKAVHTFATANRLMERYPEYRFGYSQPASYAAVERRSPEIMRAVRQRIRQRRWDVTGATEVESDTVLACGEALARSFLIGQKRFAALRGSPARVLWLPDVFGYSPCVPQIMQQCGVDYFYTTKLSWNALNRFPYSSFIWRGLGGAEVTAHISEGGYNQELRAATLRRAERTHRQSDVHREFLAPVGFGDGGGGPTEEMCESARRLANLAGLPRAEWGNIEPFFDRLQNLRAQLPVYEGELYLEYHRGTYTTHGDIKAGMRRAERALQVHEAVRCATTGQPLNEEPWRRVVFAQFHDYIPGSSVHEVYDEARVELAGITREALSAAEQELGAERGAEALFNPLPRPRRHLLGANAAGEVTSVELPPLAGAPVAQLTQCAPLPPVRATARRLANGRVVADFDKQGRVRQLRVDGRDVALAAPLGELVIYPDRPHAFEAWDIDRQALALGEPVRTTAVGRVEQAGPASATLAFTRSLGAAGEITLRYTLEAGAAQVRLDIDLDWRKTEALLKILFPTKYTGNHARFAAPFGSVLRSQKPGDPVDEAKWEVPASRWAAVGDETEGEGLFVVTESKFGFSAREGTLGLSLVRSALITCEKMEGERNSHPAELRRTHAASPFSDIGRHQIALAFGLHDANAPRDEQPAALADLLFAAPVAYRGAARSAGFLGLDGGETLQPVWAKPAGRDRWVLRLNETLGRRGRARVQLAPGWRASLVDLREKPVNGGRAMTTLAFQPYALLSLLIERRR